MARARTEIFGADQSWLGSATLEEPWLKFGILMFSVQGAWQCSAVREWEKVARPGAWPAVQGALQGQEDRVSS